MARRKDQPAPEPELRQALAAHYREEAATHPERTDAGRRDGSFFLSPWRRLAEALEAGEVVDVGGWEIKSGGRTSTLDSATGSRRTARRWPSRTTPTHEGDDERTDSLPTI